MLVLTNQQQIIRHVENETFCFIKRHDEATKLTRKHHGFITKQTLFLSASRNYLKKIRLELITHLLRVLFIPCCSDPSPSEPASWVSNFSICGASHLGRPCARLIIMLNEVPTFHCPLGPTSYVGSLLQLPVRIYSFLLLHFFLVPVSTMIPIYTIIWLSLTFLPREL